MKIPMSFTHQVSLDSPFPAILQPGLLYLSSQLNGTILRLHNACFFNFGDEFGNHWELFFEPINKSYDDFRHVTRLDAYVRYAADRNRGARIRWLSPIQNLRAFQVRLHNFFFNSRSLVVTYDTDDVVEQWFTADHDISQFQMLAVQQVIARLWKRQHYYKKYIEGVPNL